jgi:glycerol-3-phosphate dehydrogenase
MAPVPDTYDVLVVGGGINGAGIARDAAGRGLRVALCERDDLAGATSSTSSKLIHGGLRYLEQYEFRLVSEALAEREILLRTAPHLVSPLTFVLPWIRGMRPRWMLRTGLWLYDHLAHRSVLPGSRSICLRTGPYADGLKDDLTRGFSYSDCWADDARLVVLNCRAAANLGATIHTRTQVISARRDNGFWRVVVAGTREPFELRTKTLVNAAGPWVRAVLTRLVGHEPTHQIRLVKGSHIVVPRLYDGNHAFILQNDDGRVVLVIPFRNGLSLVGTTDVPHSADAREAIISGEEIAYLCRAVNRYFRREIDSSEILWSYSGVRPLYDDGAANLSEVTRDYRLLVDEHAGLPLLSIYGGKLTTYRKLAVHALDKLKPWLPEMTQAWTHAAALPGGDVGPDGMPGLIARLSAEYPALPPGLVAQLAHRHGAATREVLTDARNVTDLGVHFGADLYAREVDYFIDREWARAADDVLWRRTKAGLELDDNAQKNLSRHISDRLSQTETRPAPVR